MSRPTKMTPLRFPVGTPREVRTMVEGFCLAFAHHYRAPVMVDGRPHRLVLALGDQTKANPVVVHLVPPMMDWTERKVLETREQDGVPVEVTRKVKINRYSLGRDATSPSMAATALIRALQKGGHVVEVGHHPVY